VASLRSLAAKRVLEEKLGQSNSAATKLSTQLHVALNLEDRMLDNRAHLGIARHVAWRLQTRRRFVIIDQRITLRFARNKRYSWRRSPM
jgi:hypothetical protein